VLSRLVFPEPDAPIIAQNPPEILPETLSNSTVLGIVRVETFSFEKVRTVDEDIVKQRLSSSFLSSSKSPKLKSFIFSSSE
jgi:hypothetical protein